MNWKERYLKIAIISLISFGWVHFMSDKLLLKLGVEKYLKIKNIIGKITIVLTVNVLIIIIITLIF